MTAPAAHPGDAEAAGLGWPDEPDEGPEADVSRETAPEQQAAGLGWPEEGRPEQFT